MEEVCGAPGDALGMVDRSVWLDKAQTRKPSSKRLGKLFRKTVGSHGRLLNGAGHNVGSIEDIGSSYVSMMDSQDH